MKPIKFSLILVLIILVSTLSSVYLPQIFEKPSYWDIHGALIGLYTIICILAFVLGNKIANGKNTKYFTYLILINVMAKMFITAIVVLVYFKLNGKPDIFMMLPFGVIYLLYTVFESWFLILINPKT